MSSSKEEKYRPENWMYAQIPENVTLQLLRSLTNPSLNFRETRNRFISSCIEIVDKEHQDRKTDMIDSQIRGDSISGTGSQGCSDSQIDPYKSFAKPSTSSPPQIVCQAGEPDFVNPNSYQSITNVIQAIGIRAGVKQYGTGSRELLMVECDGLPYNIIRDIIANVFRCSKCSSCYYGLESFKQHNCFNLESIEPKREFSWLLPVSGLLHIEMNIARSFSRLNWQVYLSELGNLLGFKSSKAQEYLKKGSCHHKLWHFFEIVYSSISLELMVPYVRASKLDGIKPTCDGYWEWAKTVVDPNYLYMQESILSYLHGLMMLRSGVRTCNADYIDDATAKLSHLRYGQNHPIYQNIIFQNAKDKFLIPLELKEITKKFVSGSKSGTPGKCQGGDAMLEELNKENKSWLKTAGVPSNEQWLEVFRILTI